MRDEQDREKAKFIFDQVLRGAQWAGPEYDFDRCSYKARIDSGPLKGELLYISVEKLRDTDISAEHIQQELLIDMRQKELNRKG